MDSTVMPKPTEADDVLALRADERLAHAYEQIARADEQLARLTEQMTRMEHEARQAPVAPARRRPRDRAALRGFIGLLAAACIAGVAFVSQSSYGEAVKPIIARYVGSDSWLPQAKQELAQHPAAPAVRLASAEAAPALATPSAQDAPQDAASPAAVLTSAELTQLLQTMARDLASLQQGIDQLKASQEQLASDNAKAVEQFRASQEQMTRLVAKVSEQEQRVAARPPAAAPPRPVAEPVRRPVPVQASSQARAQPMQLQPAATAR
ncbi:hypothetical protein JQ628_21355 [Bradyrhizobium lablabi]|uniref:hypothetical protein n=1 Tax=Bradyrhizobium lablabi TaxID=722472 RepID=UPI001BA8DDB1|nr:hypothetical protein [Bradyrhizobium lablabi]MBR1124091.1 hypothetical protein [Bradyrhizobium lablabi]